MKEYVVTRPEELQCFIDTLTLVDSNMVEEFTENDYIYKKSESLITENNTTYEIDGKSENPIESDFNKAYLRSKYKTLKMQSIYTLGDNGIIIENYIVPSTITIIKCNIDVPNSFVDITNNKLYRKQKIRDGKLITDVVIEGGDFAGKTTLVRELINYGIVCQDRSIGYISPFMTRDFSSKDRIIGLTKLLDIKFNNQLVIFLVNTNKNDIQKRFDERKELGEIENYDDEALFYNKMYLDTYVELKYLKNIEIINSSNKSKSEVLEEAKTLIRRFF